MEHFKNEVIDTMQLPRFEAVVLSKLDSKYGKVIGINILITFLFFGVGLAALLFLNPPLQDYWLQVLILYVVVIFFVILFSVVSLKKKAFAFRTHDVIFQSLLVHLDSLYRALLPCFPFSRQRRIGANSTPSPHSCRIR